MLEIKDLWFSHKKREILKSISFSAKRGEITTILGPNGAGKSTLFKCITGIWKNHKGEVWFNKERVDYLPFEKRAKLFSIVPQHHDPPFPYTVFEVILMGRASYVGLFSTPSKKDYQKAEEALNLVGIYHLKDQPYTKISGGERQLTLIARALAQETPIMVLDEPTSNLDFKNQYFILNKIRGIVKERNLIGIVTLHDPNLASIFSDKLVVIKDGQVLYNGEPKEILKKEVLKEVYRVEVQVLSYDGVNIIFPKF